MKRNIELLWLIACKSASVDGETNNISLRDVIEEITIEQRGKNNVIKELPKNKFNVPIEMEIVSMWKKMVSKEEPISCSAELEIVDPKGSTLHKVEYQFELKENIERARNRIKMNAFPITLPGDYKIGIKLKENGKFVKVGELPLTIKLKVDVK